MKKPCLSWKKFRLLLSSFWCLLCGLIAINQFVLFLRTDAINFLVLILALLWITGSYKNVTRLGREIWGGGANEEVQNSHQDGRTKGTGFGNRGM